ncbi:fatty acid--CoA ligase [Thermodesulfobacteriota bacterium]
MFVNFTQRYFLRRAVKLYGNKTGVVDGSLKLTYREFDERVNRLSNALLDMGVRPGDRVAIIEANSHYLLEALYGIISMGAVIVTINIRLFPREILHILNDCEAKVLIFHEEYLPLVDELKDQLRHIKEFLVIPVGKEPPWGANYDRTIEQASSSAPIEPEVDENALAQLFYTSGTTGNPKGVMLSQRHIYGNAMAGIISTRFTDADNFLHLIPMFHVNGWGTPQAVTCMGGCHVMLRQFDPEAIFRLIAQERVTKFFAVATMMNILMNHESINKYDLGSLEMILLGGAPAAPSVIKEAERVFDCDCHAGYGMTEAGPILTASLPKAHLAGQTEEERLQRLAKPGLEAVGVELRVIGDDGREIAMDGQEIGEIVVHSNNIMLGYWNLPEETEKAFTEDGWFRTGDMATIDPEGYISIVDRKKDVIISGGENIASIEVERAILAHSSVLEAAVIGVPDEKWGEVPKAVIVLKSGETVTEKELVQHCREHLSRFKVPKSFDFVESLPKSGTAKILKRELREKYWEGLDKRVH